MIIGFSSSGFALTINDPGVVGIIDAGTQNSSVDNEIDWANYLLSLGANATTFHDGNIPPDGVTEYYETSSTDYNGTLTGGLQIGGATPNVSGYDWVLGKYDGQNAGYVLFYMPGSSIPEFSYSIWGDNVGQYQLSHVTVFGSTPVPEPGTIVLMGLGLVGLAGMGRKRLFKK